jgi:hypothetical protein
VQSRTKGLGGLFSLFLASTTLSTENLSSTSIMDLCILADEHSSNLIEVSSEFERRRTSLGASCRGIKAPISFNYLSASQYKAAKLYASDSMGNIFSASDLELCSVYSRLGTQTGSVVMSELERRSLSPASCGRLVQSHMLNICGKYRDASRRAISDEMTFTEIREAADETSRLSSQLSEYGMSPSQCETSSTTPSLDAPSQTIKREDYASYTEYANAVGAHNRAQKHLAERDRQYSQSPKLIAFGCEPHSGNVNLKSSSPDYRTAPRSRYIFMDRAPNGDITQFCIDEIGTNETEAITCVKGDDITTGADSVSVIYFAGFLNVKIKRADAVMYTEHTDGASKKTYQYSCAPSQNASKVLDYVNNEKRKQKSGNVF